MTSDAHLTYDWATIEIGTPVKIIGQRGDYTFRKIDANGDIEVHGGSGGRAMIRTFHADRVRIPKRRRTSRGDES